MSNRIVVRPNGPLIARGDIRVEDADGNLLVADSEVFLCRCGASKNKPYCDGTHKKIGFSDPAIINDINAEAPAGEGPLVISVRNNAMLVARGPMQIESEGGHSSSTRNKAALCRCGQSGNKPFCDSSHNACGFKG